MLNLMTVEITYGDVLLVFHLYINSNVPRKRVSDKAIFIEINVVTMM